MKDRPIRRIWGMAAPILIVSVFLWGLQYKLSLYDPAGAASHSVPIAKLLSKNEQPRIPAHPAAGASSRASGAERSIATAAWALAALLFVLVLRPAHIQVTSANRRRFAFFCLRSFFVRPPPALA
jgi:hypothetical protein